MAILSKIFKSRRNLKRRRFLRILEASWWTNQIQVRAEPLAITVDAGPTQPTTTLTLRRYRKARSIPSSILLVRRKRNNQRGIPNVLPSIIRRRIDKSIWMPLSRIKKHMIFSETTGTRSRLAFKLKTIISLWKIKSCILRKIKKTGFLRRGKARRRTFPSLNTGWTSLSPRKGTVSPNNVHSHSKNQRNRPDTVLLKVLTQI